MKRPKNPKMSCPISKRQLKKILLLTTFKWRQRASFRIWWKLKTTHKINIRKVHPCWNSILCLFLKVKYLSNARSHQVGVIKSDLKKIYRKSFWPSKVFGHHWKKSEHWSLRKVISLCAIKLVQAWAQRQFLKRTKALNWVLNDLKLSNYKMNNDSKIVLKPAETNKLLGTPIKRKNFNELADWTTPRQSLLLGSNEKFIRLQSSNS